MTNNKYWIFLEALRKSGITNMFAATPYIMEEFEVNYDVAKTILKDWMENYNPKDYEN